MGQPNCWWLTPAILATQEAEIRIISIQSWPRANISQDLSQLVQGLKVKALSSSPSTAKKEKKERGEEC
jgi:hypothetical protein